MYSLQDRVTGGIIGSALGDALGAPCECLDYREIRKVLGEYQGIEQILANPAQFLPIAPSWWPIESCWDVTDDRHHVYRAYWTAERRRPISSRTDGGRYHLGQRARQPA